jgi:hypothetical protein
MSIAVALDELRDVVAQQAPFAYFLTVSDDGRPHAVAIRPVVGDADITFDAGSKSCANATARPDATLLWPPNTHDDYSLIVDGTATVAAGTVRLAPAKAIRHRPAPGGGSDCAPVSLES